MPVGLSLFVRGTRFFWGLNTGKPNEPPTSILEGSPKKARPRLKSA